mmetsp:Transcript_70507/g.181699  ORF Transcript_70507/g.181699 Transcript_70507/m.181699 type:complete len:217 (+) Transcript_70507:534-1184(+)
MVPPPVSLVPWYGSRPNSKVSGTTLGLPVPFVSLSMGPPPAAPESARLAAAVSHWKNSLASVFAGLHVSEATKNMESTTTCSALGRAIRRTNSSARSSISFSSAAIFQASCSTTSPLSSAVLRAMWTHCSSIAMDWKEVPALSECWRFATSWLQSKTFFPRTASSFCTVCLLSRSLRSSWCSTGSCQSCTSAGMWRPRKVCSLGVRTRMDRRVYSS